MTRRSDKRVFLDSGQQWLGKIPSDWELKRLKLLVSCVGGGTPNTSNADYWNGNIPWVSPKDMKQSVIAKTEDYLTERGVRESATTLIEPNAVLLVVRSGILKHSIPVARNLVSVALNQDMKALRATGQLTPEFLFWIIEGHQRQLLPLWSKQGCTVESIELPAMLNTALPVPSTTEQKAITRFLDHKTTQIDALIAKKQTLLDRLAEKRASLISQSITKGLNPTSQQIDSGISWFGAVPLGWRIVPFKWCCRITEGQVDPTVPGYAELPLIAPNHIESDTGRLLGVETAEEQGAISGKYFYKAGTVLYSKIRPALVKACIAPSDGLCSADMYPIYPSGGLTSKFLIYQLLSRSFTQFAVLVSDRVAMPKVNREAIGTFPIIVPPLEEQHQICEFLDRVIGKLDDQAGHVRLAIAKLQEYRTSLITHAVTGQIDVRHVPIPEPAHA